MTSKVEYFETYFKMYLKEFNEETLDGREVLSTIVFEDGKLVHTQKAIKAKKNFKKNEY